MQTYAKYCTTPCYIYIQGYQTNFLNSLKWMECFHFMDVKTFYLKNMLLYPLYLLSRTNRQPNQLLDFLATNMQTNQNAQDLILQSEYAT